MFFLFRLTSYLVPTIVSERGKVARVVGSVFLLFNILYFTNAIPPLPLALKESGVYHKVEKSGDIYALLAEPSHWYEVYLRYNSVFNRAPGESVFVFSSVFAPTKLSTTVLHEWEYYDEKTSAWVRSGTFGFPITGGRTAVIAGTRFGENIEAGKWRVNVKTGNGLIIGRISFTIVDVSVPVATIEKETEGRANEIPAHPSRLTRCRDSRELYAAMHRV